MKVLLEGKTVETSKIYWAECSCGFKVGYKSHDEAIAGIKKHLERFPTRVRKTHVYEITEAVICPKCGLAALWNEEKGQYECRSQRCGWTWKPSQKTKQQKTDEEDLLLNTLDPKILVLDEFQPRTDIKGSDEEWQQFLDSIKATGGNLEPILVWKKNKKYVVLSGHRRALACKELGINANVRILLDEEIDEKQAWEIAILSNIARKDVSLEEEVNGYIKLKELGMTEEEIARKVGRSKSYLNRVLAVAQRNQLKPLWNTILAGDVSLTLGFEVLSVPEEYQDMFMRFILEYGASRDQIRELKKIMKHSQENMEMIRRAYEDREEKEIIKEILEEAAENENSFEDYLEWFETLSYVTCGKCGERGNWEDSLYGIPYCPGCYMDILSEVNQLEELLKEITSAKEEKIRAVIREGEEPLYVRKSFAFLLKARYEKTLKKFKHEHLLKLWGIWKQEPRYVSREKIAAFLDEYYPIPREEEKREEQEETGETAINKPKTLNELIEQLEAEKQKQSQQSQEETEEFKYQCPLCGLFLIEKIDLSPQELADYHNERNPICKGEMQKVEEIIFYDEEELLDKPGAIAPIEGNEVEVPEEIGRKIMEIVGEPEPEQEEGKETKGMYDGLPDKGKTWYWKESKLTLNWTHMTIEEEAVYDRRDRTREGICIYALVPSLLPEIRWALLYEWGGINQRVNPLSEQGDTIRNAKDLNRDTRGKWKLKNKEYVQKALDFFEKAIREKLGEILYIQYSHHGPDIMISKKDGVVSVWERGKILGTVTKTGEKTKPLFSWKICDEEGSE